MLTAHDSCCDLGISELPGAGLFVLTQLLKKKVLRPECDFCTMKLKKMILLSAYANETP